MKTAHPTALPHPMTGILPPIRQTPELAAELLQRQTRALRRMAPRHSHKRMQNTTPLG